MGLAKGIDSICLVGCCVTVEVFLNFDNWYVVWSGCYPCLDAYIIEKSLRHHPLWDEKIASLLKAMIQSNDRHWGNKGIKRSPVCI